MTLGGCLNSGEQEKKCLIDAALAREECIGLHPLCWHLDVSIFHPLHDRMICCDITLLFVTERMGINYHGKAAE